MGKCTHYRFNCVYNDNSLLRFGYLRIRCNSNQVGKLLTFGDSSSTVYVYDESYNLVDSFIGQQNVSLPDDTTYFVDVKEDTIGLIYSFTTIKGAHETNNISAFLNCKAVYNLTLQACGFVGNISLLSDLKTLQTLDLRYNSSITGDIKSLVEGMSAQRSSGTLTFRAGGSVTFGNTSIKDSDTVTIVFNGLYNDATVSKNSAVIGNYKDGVWS